MRVTIPRFSLAHDTFQPADSAKYLIFSTRDFELAPDRPATFAVDLAVENLGGEPGDYRLGMAAFHAFDFEVTKRVFAVCGTSTRVLALHEQLGAWGAGDPFYHVVESPYEEFDDDFTRLRTCEIIAHCTGSNSTARSGVPRPWRVSVTSQRERGPLSVRLPARAIGVPEHLAPRLRRRCDRRASR